MKHIEKIEKALQHAMEKHPDGSWPWDLSRWTLNEMCGVVHTKAGEFAQAAQKHHMTGEKTLDDIRGELYQNIAMSLRVLDRIEELEKVANMTKKTFMEVAA